MSKNRENSALHDSIMSAMRNLNRVGKSKHQAKQEAIKKAHDNGVFDMREIKTEGIYSSKTWGQYLEIGMKFADWMQEHHADADVRRISYAYKQGYCEEYVQERIDRGFSPYTIARDCSALAKICGVTSDDIYADRPSRSIRGITRSREYTEAGFKRDIKRYGDVVEFERIIGTRRVELQHVAASDFSFHADGSATCHLDGKRHETKGGKDRDIYIQPDNVDRLKTIIDATQKPADEPLFPYIPKNIDVHGIRAMYAGDLYNYLRRPYEAIEGKRDDVKPYRNRNKIYRTAPSVLENKKGGKFDRQALKTVSESLGHNRVQVISDHYTRFCKSY